MADQSSDQTLKQMLAGFSAMQFNLGLLPMQTSAPMAGAPFQAPPPPPPMPHPSEAAMAAMAAHQNMIQQTLQAAQMTRYPPPPSAPMPSVSVMGGMSPFAGMMGGGFGGGGGGFGGGAAPGFAGGATNVLGSMGPAPRLPSIFNPFAPTLPAAHFSSPAMRSLQVMQTQQSQMMGTIAGIGEGALGIGGSILGGMVGGRFGMLGGIAGSLGGGMLAHGVANMIFNPVTQDFARGRQIQAMTAPFMVSGPNMNTMTGQGLSAQAGRDVATGIRHLQRDYDFERTGFNTQDALRIMQMSASTGLLTGANSPDQIVSKVKEISKTVKVLMRITGDPDVRDAIQSLGQMRELGFAGLGAQAGAVANRAAFARMAGMSQAGMNQVGMAGAGMAEQFGLAGSTGYSAGMAGAGLANLAASSGALNDLQLARAGGRQGLGQISAMGQLASMQDERYLLAAMGRDSKGRMTVDMDAYRRAQSMSFDEVTRRSADALREMGAKGIFEWNTRKQEFKDQIAQKLTPLEMNLNMFRQARAFMNEVPGMTMGTAIQSISGMSAEQARALELQGQSRAFWDAQIQQLRVQRRDAADRERANREQYRTPGVMTHAGRGIRGFLGDVSDTVSSPFRSVAEHFERVREDDEAAARGERINRYSDVDIAHDDAERQMMRAAMGRGDVQRAFRRGGSSFLDRQNVGLGDAFLHAGGRQLNRMGSMFGLVSDSDENRLVSIASRSRGTAFGLHPFGSFGDAGDALQRVQGVMEAARAGNVTEISTDQSAALMKNIGTVARGKNVNGAAVLNETTRNVVSRLKDLKAGIITSATALSGDDLRAAYMQAATAKGMSQSEATKSWNENKGKIMEHVAQDVYASGDKSLIEPWEKAKDTLTEAGGVNLTRSREAAEKDIKDKLEMAGIGDVSEETLGKVKSVLAHHDQSTIAMATAIAAQTGGNKREREGAARVLADLEKTMSPEKYAAARKEALTLAHSMDTKTKDAFEMMLRGQQDAGGMMSTIRLAKQGLGEKMGLAAQNEFLQRLDDIHKGAGAAGTVEEAVGMLSDDDLDRLEKKDPKLAALLRRGRDKGDAAAISQAVERGSPKTTQTRSGGGEGASIDSIDKQISDIEALRDQVATGDGDSQQVQAATSQLDAAATQLFAGAVKDFVGAVGDLKGHSDEKQLGWASPWIQSRVGGDH